MLWWGKVCRHRTPVLGRSLDTRGAVGLVDWHSWACTMKAPDGWEELTPLGRQEAKTLVDPTLSLALKHGKLVLPKHSKYHHINFLACKFLLKPSMEPTINNVLVKLGKQ